MNHLFQSIGSMSKKRYNRITMKNTKVRGFRNSDIYIYKKGIIHTNLLIDDEGRIKAIGDDVEAEGLIEVPKGQIVVPGFIDEHIHGSDGFDAMNGTRKDLEMIVKSLPQDGVTSFNFTTMTMNKETILKALRNIKDYMNSPIPGSEALGIHVEGPFIDKSHCGAQNQKDVLELDEGFLKEMIEESGNQIREITITYQPNHEAFFKLLRDNNITISLGHTNNTLAEANKAFDLGATCGTHMFNAMRNFKHREVGVIGALLLNDNAYCELICDLHHVSKEAIQLLYRMKGKEKIILITDSMEAKHMKEGTYHLGGQEVFVQGGIATLKDGTLAGSILTMNEAIRNIKGVLNLELTDAIDMATVNPAKNLSLFDKKGSIEEKKDADFTIIDSEMNIYKTIVKGQTVYEIDR